MAKFADLPWVAQGGFTPVRSAKLAHYPLLTGVVFQRFRGGTKKHSDR